MNSYNLQINIYIYNLLIKNNNLLKEQYLFAPRITKKIKHNLHQDYRSLSA